MWIHYWKLLKQGPLSETQGFIGPSVSPLTVIDVGRFFYGGEKKQSNLMFVTSSENNGKYVSNNHIIIIYTFFWGLKSSRGSTVMIILLSSVPYEQYAPRGVGYNMQNNYFQTALPLKKKVIFYIDPRHTFTFFKTYLEYIKYYLPIRIYIFFKFEYLIDVLQAIP